MPYCIRARTRAFSERSCRWKSAVRDSTFSARGNLQFKCADTRGKLALVAPVAVALSVIGSFLRSSAKVVGHLSLQNLILWSAPEGQPCLDHPEGALGSSRHRSQVSKVAIAGMSVGSIGLVSNLTERGGIFYSACSITQDYGLNPIFGHGPSLKASKLPVPPAPCRRHRPAARDQCAWLYVPPSSAPSRPACDAQNASDAPFLSPPPEIVMCGLPSGKLAG